MGSSATHVMRSTGSFGSGDSPLTIRRVEDTWEGRTVLNFQTASQLQARYDPPVGWDWPLEIGTATKHDPVATVAATGQKIVFTSTWTVAAYEDVTVPAGTLKAWRLRYADISGETQRLWPLPETVGMLAKRLIERSTAHRLGAGTRVMKMLTVPALNSAQGGVQTAATHTAVVASTVVSWKTP